MFAKLPAHSSMSHMQEGRELRSIHGNKMFLYQIFETLGHVNCLNKITEIEVCNPSPSHPSCNGKTPFCVCIVLYIAFCPIRV